MNGLAKRGRYKDQNCQRNNRDGFAPPDLWEREVPAGTVQAVCLVDPQPC
jgi:hypothetical protein